MASFILQHFCSDWSEKEVETAPLMRWLVATFSDSLKPLGAWGWKLLEWLLFS